MVSTDKMLHLLVGALIVALLQPVIGWRDAGLLCLAAAIGKELYDGAHRDVHTPDVLDAVATLFGGVLAGAWLHFVAGAA